MDKETKKPVLLTETKLKKIARWEDSFRKIAGKAALEGPIAVKTPYELQPEDLLAVIEKMKSAPEGALEEEWAGPLLDRADQLFQTDRRLWQDRPTDGYHGLPCEADETLTIFEKLLAAVAVGEPDTAPLEAALKQLILDREQPVPLRMFSDEAKEHYIRYYDNKNVLDRASEAEILLYVLFVDELCTKKNVLALQAKAYACYGGNRAYACSWTKARELLLELMNLDESPGYANSLGYIYFYGRTNNGKPEYAKAFYYFSIGAAGGVYESRYKLADMFRSGLGVPRNKWICAKLINELYVELLPFLLDGVYDSKFADVALRMGDLQREGLVGEKNPAAALLFYLQARFAIKKRRETDEQYGDETVEKKIDQLIETVWPQLGIPKPVKVLEAVSPGMMTRAIPLRKEDYFELKIRPNEKGSWAVTLFRKSKKDARRHLPMLITVPEAQFCGQVEKLAFELHEPLWRLPKEAEDKKGGWTIRFDGGENDVYTLGQEETGRISGSWTLRLPKE